jgi:hypothetical protein
MAGLDDVGLAVALTGLFIALVALIHALPLFLRRMAMIRRLRRRRDPLRVLVSRHPGRDDALIVSVDNCGDALLSLGWSAVITSDGNEHLGPEIHGTPLLPGDSAHFLLERGAMPEDGVRWIRIQVFDALGHGAKAQIPRRLSALIERPAI